MIQLENVSKSYSVQKAVDAISFVVREGETLVLLGTSGCGKTTTLRMINRLTEPSSGKIFFDKRDIMSLQPDILRRSMGYVLQHIGLFPHYTVAENIAIAPKLLKWDRRTIELRTAELLEKLHLPLSSASSFPASLSGGQQQRVGLARALAANPAVLLMDEPLGALDPLTRDSIRKEFLQLDELKKKTIIMVTHDVQEAFEMADRICLMNKGKIEQIGTPKELLLNPSSNFVKSFFDQQRFQLEMRAFTLADIWPQLESANEAAGTTELQPYSSLWDAMEKMAAGNGVTEKWFAVHDSKQQNITIEEMLAAFSSTKNQMNHE